MQYKIPVQIENEDPIFLGLGLRQLLIIMIGGGAAFSLFDNLQTSVWPEIASIPAVLIFGIVLLVAIFKHSEMTFVPFFLSLLRLNLNPKERRWNRWVDSFQPIDIGYVTNFANKKDEVIDFTSKKEKLKNLQGQLDKL